MLKRRRAILFVFLPAFFACVSAWADSSGKAGYSIQAEEVLKQFGGPQGIVEYLNSNQGSAALGSVSVPTAATFTVNSTGDGSDFFPGDGLCATGIIQPFECTLRAAIQEANALLGPHTINFSIGTGVQTIIPLSPLPIITQPVTIDGTTQPGVVPEIPCIVSGHPCIELNGSNAGAPASGLVITAGNSTVRGLVINRFGFGILLETGGGNVIQRNFIGTDITGNTDLGNSRRGVDITNSSGNTIGGTAPGARNVISGNDLGGILIRNNSVGNLVQGNLIGTDVTGTAALGNRQGVYIFFPGVGNTVGGVQIGAGNVLSGNQFDGIAIDGTGNLVLGNFIGTDVNGTAILGNGSQGVRISGINNIIGGTAAGARNVISGNGGNGVFIEFGGGGNWVEGNFIGLDVSGTFALGNVGNGVRINSGAGNSIRGNRIFSSFLLGIDLNPGGATPNDAGDADAGANNLQNFPVLTQAFGDGSSTTTILGMLNSYASAPFTLEFFSNDSCDPSGYGEGRNYIGSTSVTTDGSGNASFNVTFPVSVPVGQFITATATDTAGNTSEFCECETVIACAAAKGDMNGSGDLSPADVVSMLNCVFLASGNCELCFADVNCSGGLSPADVVIELNAVFLGAAMPC